jgi:hypothetical protein
MDSDYPFNILPQMATVIVLMHQMSVSMIVCLMVFNATFNNISVISWQSGDRDRM